MTNINTSRGNYDIKNLQNFRINTVQKEWDYLGQKYYDKTTTRAVDANGRSDYKEFPMPSEIDGVMRRLMAIDNNKEDFSYEDLKGAKAALDKMNVDIKEYDLSKGVFTFVIKGGDGGYNEGKTYSVTIDVETPEEIAARNAKKQEPPKAQKQDEPNWFIKGVAYLLDALGCPGW